MLAIRQIIPQNTYSKITIISIFIIYSGYRSHITMASSKQKEIIQQQILRKVKQIADLEEKQASLMTQPGGEEFKVTRKLFACFDGFIILRSFSKEIVDPFQLVVSADRILNFAKTQLPIRTKNGLFIRLYEVLQHTIRISWAPGVKLDVGSKGGGVKIADDISTDGFQLMIFDYKEVEQVKEIIQDINFIIYTNDEFQKLREENEALKQELIKLELVQEPLIITEGKTDWKYFVAALRLFHANNEFKDIQEKWFLKFGSKNDVENKTCDASFEFENNVSKLNKIFDSYFEARTIDKNGLKPVRIGIFDSDDRQAKNRNDVENNLFSFLLEPDGISTEFLYSELELQSMVAGKRLYIGSEFNPQSKRLVKDPNINLGGDNNNLNKAGKHVIIDCDVYNTSGENIALSKEKFAQEVYNRQINISLESLSNFRKVFDKILNCISSSRTRTAR